MTSVPTTKNYIGGSARAVPTQYGEILNLSIKVEDLLKIQNAKGYAAVSVFRRKEPSAFADTHYMVDNTQHITYGSTNQPEDPSQEQVQF